MKASATKRAPPKTRSSSSPSKKRSGADSRRCLSACFIACLITRFRALLLLLLWCNGPVRSLQTVHILLRVAQSDRVKRRKGRGQRPHRVIVPSRFEKRGVQVEVGRKAGFPFESVAPRLIRLLCCLAHLALPRSLALVVQRASRIATNTVHILPRVAR